MANHKRAEPTTEQAAIMRFVLRQWRDGAIPTANEIGDEFGYHKSTVRDHLQRLKALGLIASRGVGKPWRITKAGMAFDCTGIGLHIHGGCFESAT